MYKKVVILVIVRVVLVVVVVVVLAVSPPQILCSFPELIDSVVTREFYKLFKNSVTSHSGDDVQRYQLPETFLIGCHVK